MWVQKAKNIKNALYTIELAQNRLSPCDRIAQSVQKHSRNGCAILYRVILCAEWLFLSSSLCLLVLFFLAALTPLAARLPWIMQRFQVKRRCVCVVFTCVCVCVFWAVFSSGFLPLSGKQFCQQEIQTDLNAPLKNRKQKNSQTASPDEPSQRATKPTLQRVWFFFYRDYWNPVCVRTFSSTSRICIS